MAKSNLLLRAKQYCEAGKHRFTEPRERVLALLATATAPMGAYQILEALSSGKDKVKPPTIYRAIEFWAQHGFIHRIESMNAYITCCERQHHDNTCVLICDDCSQVIELNMPQLPTPIYKGIKQKDFTISGANIEVHGLCEQCH